MERLTVKVHILGKLRKKYMLGSGLEDTDMAMELGPMLLEIDIKGHGNMVKQRELVLSRGLMEIIMKALGMDS